MDRIIERIVRKFSGSYVRKVQKQYAKQKNISPKKISTVSFNKIQAILDFGGR